MKNFTIFLLIFSLIMLAPIVIHAEELFYTDPVVATETSSVIPETPIILGPPAMIVVHRISNTCFVYDANSQILNTFIVSTGREGHRTPLGTYSIYAHATGAGYHPMVDGTYGRFCMRFKKGGYMFHSVCYAYPGAPTPIPEEILSLGTSVSRGCIRLNVADAEWLYNTTPNGCLVTILDD
ncbi:L,D-transpeptidase family protein [Candidatus Saccharibacteria bacterium]|nr:L,D-transpeptidase family protein [Candidatus Saccharibacteria bacterium]